MIFKGYSKEFTTVDNKQYDLIGDFWDEMSLKHGMENLRGLGFNWTKTTIEYVIGLKENSKFKEANLTWKEIELPDDSWLTVEGNTEELSEIYNKIYSVSNLKYEIEMFNNDGTCKIMFIREK